MFWPNGMTESLPSSSWHGTAAMQKADSLEIRCRELEHHIGRLAMFNQAMWEIVRDRLNLTDADLERVATEVDLRDGVRDGRITEGPLQCPTCGHISNSRHWKCLYCGQQFEKPIMG